MDTPQIMLSNMSDLDVIYSSYITGEMSNDSIFNWQGWHVILCVQYRHEDKMVIIHMIIITEMVGQITWHSRHLDSNDVLSDTTHYL